MLQRPYVYICSPYRGDIKVNEKQAREYCRKAYEAGYTPLAPHLYFTQFLNDNIQPEREAGIDMANNLLKKCTMLIVCGDRISEGMAAEIELAFKLGIPIKNISEIKPVMEQKKSKQRNTNQR